MKPKFYSLAATAAALGISLHDWPPGYTDWDRPVKAKPLVKCLLPSCEVVTKHNGGYCCAEHCKEHRKMLKAK